MHINHLTCATWKTWPVSLRTPSPELQTSTKIENQRLYIVVLSPHHSLVVLAAKMYSFNSPNLELAHDGRDVKH